MSQVLKILLNDIDTVFSSAIFISTLHTYGSGSKISYKITGKMFIVQGNSSDLI